MFESCLGDAANVVHGLSLARARTHTSVTECIHAGRLGILQRAPVGDWGEVERLFKVLIRADMCGVLGHSFGAALINNAFVMGAPITGSRH